MLGFLLDSWRRKRADRRKIFFFRVGGRACRVDPLTIVHRLNQVEPQWETLLGTIGHSVPDVAGAEMRVQAEKARNDAAVRIVEVGRQVFGMPPLTNDERGCTEAEVIGTFTGFVVFMAGLAEAARPFYPASAPASIPAVG